MFKSNFILLGFAFLFILISFQGCTFRSDNCNLIDDTAPFSPQGVYSVSGDGKIYIEWYANQEKDLKGYIVYRSSERDRGYKEITKISSNSYIDTDVRNGNTYYYAVSAFDYDGNESPLSYKISDTPRPEGNNVRLTDYIINPRFTGFDFNDPDRGAQMYDWERPNLYNYIDIYFGVDTAVSVPYIYSDNDTLIQDLGYTDSMDEVDMSPTKGFTTLFVEAITGHTYAFLTPEGNYAKIRITDLYVDWAGNTVRDAWVKFDWAFQLQKGNPDLAPKNILGK
jgi:hypothetical protein